MAHYCICPKCGLRFDRDKIQAVKVSARRYGHATCYPDNTDFMPIEKVDEELIKLKEYIKKLLGNAYNEARVNKQIKEYKEEKGYSYSGILKSLVYFYEVKGNSKDKANGGIGIVPFIYQDAFNYYFSLFQAQQQNETKDVVSFTSKVKEVIINLPKAYTPLRLFNLDDEEEMEDE